MMTKISFILGLSVINFFMSDANAMPNPWVDCGTNMACGTKTAGFTFPLRIKNYTVRAMKDMLEIRFPLDSKRNVIVRKSTSFETGTDKNGFIDISGDYNNYPTNKIVTMKNGVEFSVRGNENDYKVVNFAAESGYYCIMCDEGLQLDDLEYFYNLLKEAESPK